MSTTPFTLGEKVVYPNHGVGVIEQISNRTIGSTVERYYLLCIRASNLKVTVPFKSVGAVGLRRVATNEEAEEVLKLLSTGGREGNSDWKERFKENSDRMRTGSLLEIAGVLKGLLMLATQKPLSPREKKMLESARYLLVSEMAMARNIAEDAVRLELDSALGKCKLRWPETEVA